MLWLRLRTVFFLEKKGARVTNYTVAAEREEVGSALTGVVTGWRSEAWKWIWTPYAFMYPPISSVLMVDTDEKSLFITVMSCDHPPCMEVWQPRTSFVAAHS